MLKKTILVTGGSGYVGTKLIKNLITKGYRVINVDINLFGNYFHKNKNIKNFKININDINKIECKNIFACIHLASIANDPMSDLNPGISWETSPLGTMILMEFLIKKKVRKIIYASSGSVYGIKKEKKVTEDLQLKPISTYNKAKMVTERVIMSYRNKIKIIILRPATVCGISDRMRLDLTVNLLTYQALKNKKIIVFGGKQKRPNVHIDDMISAYLFFLTKNIEFGIFNVGFENLSILEMAKIIALETGAKIVIKNNTNDPRSYNLDSSKIIKLGFIPKKNIRFAIREFKRYFNSGKFIEKPNYHSIEWLKKTKQF